MGLESIGLINAPALSGQIVGENNHNLPTLPTNTQLNRPDEAMRHLYARFAENTVPRAGVTLTAPDGVTLHRPGPAPALNRSGWQIVGEWKGAAGNYKAEVVATKDTSLKELARLITGDENNWRLFNQPNEKVKAGTKIDAAPLLAQMETQLRGRVEIARKSFNTKFPGTPAQVKLAGVLDDNCTPEQVATGQCGVTISPGDKAPQINKYFDSKKDGFRDCRTAVQTIYAKAVLDQIGVKTFNELGYDISYVPLDIRTVSDIKDTKNGDWVRFDNYPDYTERMNGGGAWAAENAIKVGADRFWGHPDQPNASRTEEQWLKELDKYYREDTKASPIGKVPGYANDDVRFIDVSKLATDLFNYRAAQTSRRGRQQ
jgi:hypothetical protein